MSTMHIAQTVFETGVVLLFSWGILNEDKFIRFENKIKNEIKKAWRRLK